MSDTKTIVCLANSWKHGSGRCVAGRETSPKPFGPWLRPVSERAGQEVSEEERQYENGQDPRVLDIITLKLLKPLPEKHQRENYLLDPSQHWIKQGTVSWAELQSAVEDPAGPLWINGRSSSNGTNDQVPEYSASTLPRSLYLIRPTNLVVSVAMEGGTFAPAKRKVRASFRVAGHDYRFAVTDPVVAKEYLGRADGDTKVAEAIVCVSLAAEAVGGNCYKLIATIITPERAGGK